MCVCRRRLDVSHCRCLWDSSRVRGCFCLWLCVSASPVWVLRVGPLLGVTQCSPGMWAFSHSSLPVLEPSSLTLRPAPPLERMQDHSLMFAHLWEKFLSAPSCLLCSSSKHPHPYMPTHQKPRNWPLEGPVWPEALRARDGEESAPDIFAGTGCWSGGATQVLISTWERPQHPRGAKPGGRTHGGGKSSLHLPSEQVGGDEAHRGRTGRGGWRRNWVSLIWEWGIIFAAPGPCEWSIYNWGSRVRWKHRLRPGHAPLCPKNGDGDAAWMAGHTRCETLTGSRPGVQPLPVPGSVLWLLEKSQPITGGFRS